MPRSEIIERERRWARPVAIAAFGVMAMAVAGLFVVAGVDLAPRDDDSEYLRTYGPNSGTLVPATILQAVGYGLVALPLLYLFRAAQARSERVRGALVGVVVAGPLFLAAAFVIQAFAYDSLATDYIASGGAPCVGEEFNSAVKVDDCVADRVIAEEGLLSVAGGLLIAGTLGLIFGMIYTTLNAMRVGLLTRFMGTLGMAVGASLVFFGPPFIILYMVGLGAVILGWVPGGRPPAWDAGEAIPWPSPGEQRAPGPDPDEPVEGRADEIFPDARPPLPEEESEPEGPQKRKRRG